MFTRFKSFLVTALTLMLFACGAATAAPDPAIGSTSPAQSAPLSSDIASPTNPSLATQTVTVEDTSAPGVIVDGQLTYGDPGRVTFAFLLLNEQGNFRSPAFVYVIAGFDANEDGTVDQFEQVCDKTVQPGQIVYCDIPYHYFDSLTVKVTDATEWASCEASMPTEISVDGKDAKGSCSF